MSEMSASYERLIKKIMKIKGLSMGAAEEWYMEQIDIRFDESLKQGDGHPDEIGLLKKAIKAKRKVV